MPGRILGTSAARSIVQTIQKIGGATTDINVVSSGLCDDIVQRLAPSLTPHRGCSIIDIHPGSGLFSRKLHKYLKPRSHILVEPIHDFHQPFLQSLVDTPGSKYHLRDWQFSDAVELSTYLKDGLLAESGHGAAVAQGDAPNHSILILVNMARGKATRARTVGKFNSHYRILSFMNALRHRTGLHSHGPVRMLLWLDDKEKKSLLPQTVSTRKKISLQLETYCHVEEIVGGGSWGQQYRDTALDLQSGAAVAKRIRDRGIVIPGHRQDELQRQIGQPMITMNHRNQAFSTVTGREWQKELQQLQAAFDRGEFSQQEGGPPGPHEKRSIRNGPPITPEFRRLRQLRSNTKHGTKLQNALESLLQQEAEIDSIQTEILHGNLDQAQRENKLEEQGRLRDKLKATLETSEESLIAKFALMGDDRRALALDPPLLMWDRREAEPLLARDDEFYSPRKLALLDFRPIAPRPWSMDQEQTILYDYLLTHMYYSGIQTLKSLDHLAPGAFEAVAPHIPELKDPLKGGRYDIEEVRARTLTPELLYKVTLAWQRWHFRPSIQELLSLHEPEALGPEESIDNP